MTLNFQFPNESHVLRVSASSREHDRKVVAGAAEARYKPYRRVFKRVFDVVAVLVSLPIVLPIIAGLATLVALKGGRPFYSHTRVGKDGKEFRMWKLRSMVVDADERMVEHLSSDEQARREWEATQKLRNDPRITQVGHVLRKSSLDELPQLWNVLIGDMSLVGPRPMMPCQKALYPSDAYYSMRPGITGYWQTSARNNSTFAARAEFDAAYERDLSFAVDIGVLLRTVSVVARGTGV